ncbi:MAG: hypothetical protein WCR40_00070 [Candidatus Paceibacterota bacterium]
MKKNIVVFFILFVMSFFSSIYVVVFINSTIEVYKQLNSIKPTFFLKEDITKNSISGWLLLMQPQVLALAGIIVTVYDLYKLGYNTPNIIRKTIRLLARILNFLALCLLKLISEEKKLTFAICTASRTVLGLYLGREIVCSISGAVIAGILIFISDKTRVWLEKKQGNCVCNT